MVNIQNLRKGNWIIHNELVRPFLKNEYSNLKNFSPIIVDREILLDLICEPNPSHYDYIKLDINILEKFGFVKYSLCSFLEEYNFSFKDQPVYLKFESNLIFGCDVNNNIISKELEYIHQLQNWFLLCTGFELNDLISYKIFLKQDKYSQFHFNEFLKFINKDELIEIYLKDFLS